MLTSLRVWCGVRRAFSSGVIIASLGLAACAVAPPENTVGAAGKIVSPFISFVQVDGFDPSTMTRVQYTIAPKPGSVSKPVHVEYSLALLGARGYVSSNSVTLPVFGLYAGYSNQVSIELDTQAGIARSFQVTVSTPPYTDPTGIYSHPNILTPRTLTPGPGTAGSALGFDFIFIKSGLGSPVIIDTDAEIRWAVPGIVPSLSSAFVGDTFVIGDPGQATVYRLRLDGNFAQGPLPPPNTYTDFNHNIEPGKQGLLAEVDAAHDGVESIESNVIELADSSSVSIANHWDLGAILSAYMSSLGDDPTAFVRPGVDWFHSNSAIYDPSDDSVIVSSRENFVIKLDYKTGAIIWILGDPTKYWYTFSSLRAKALTLAPGGLYPIGQHALSITSDGLLMLFNDGLGSAHQPPGAPAGETRTYSTVSAYSIDEKSMTATEVWDYDAGKTIFSSFCSSAYEAPDKSVLIDYATAANDTEALLVGLDSAHNLVFEFEYANTGCGTSWNALPIALDDLKVDQ